MKTILTTTALALLAAPALAAINATEDLSAIRQPSADEACFASIADTNAFQRTYAPGCIYYRAPTGSDPKDASATEPEPADPGEGEGEAEGEGEGNENAGL